MMGAALRGVAVSVALLLPAMAGAEVCAPDRVDIRTTDGTLLSFTVELADEPEEMARGLMFRETLAEDAGMLFVYQTPRRATFWMKNTLIPLDMIFVNPAGLVVHVHENAIPGDLTPIEGGPRTLAVLEIAGGLARAVGIAPGAALRHPALPQQRALLPC